MKHQLTKTRRKCRWKEYEDISYFRLCGTHSVYIVYTENRSNIMFFFQEEVLLARSYYTAVILTVVYQRRNQFGP